MGRRASNSPTIKDVARRAAVSVGTVSRVLRQMPDVDPGLRQRVDAVIRELGYKSPSPKPTPPDRDRRARVIAFLLGNGSGLSTSHEHLLLGIEEHCSAHKYHLLFTRYDYAGDVPPDALKLPDLLLARNLVDCVIAAGTHYPNFAAALERERLNYVLLANHTVSQNSTTHLSNRVRYDDYGGFFEATSYLVQLGHKHIWYIGDISRPWFRNRYEGYRAAMIRHNLEPFAHTVALSDDAYENGHAAVSHILEQKSQLTAVIAGSEELAFGAREAVRQHGRSIPHDVSLIGFENQARRSHGMNLTSVSVDMAEVGRQLAKMAIARAEDSMRDVPEVVVPAVLMRRSTCRPVRLEQAMVL